MKTRLERLIEAGKLTAFEFEEKVKRYAKVVDRLEYQAARDVKQLLRDLDRQIRDELITKGEVLPLGKTDIFQAVDRAVDRFAAEREFVARRYAQKAIDAAGEFRQKIAAITGQQARPVQLPATLADDLATLQQQSNQAFAADLKDRLRLDIARGLRAGKTPRQIVADMVADRLVTPSRQFGNETARGALAHAENRAADEIRAFFNMTAGAQARGDRVAGKKKIWIHAGPHDETARPSHEEAETRYSIGGKPGPIPIGVNFEIEGELLMFPQDPKASAKQTKGCKCISIEILPDLADLLAPEGAEIDESLTSVD